MWSEYQLAPGVVVIRLFGEVDTLRDDGLEERMAELAREGVLIVDVCDTSFVDHGLIRSLVECARDNWGRVGVVMPTGSDHPVGSLLTRAMPEALAVLPNGKDVVTSLARVLERQSFEPASIHDRMVAAMSAAWASRARAEKLLDQQRELRLEGRRRRSAT